MLKNYRGSGAVAAARRAYDEKSSRTFVTPTYTLAGDRRLAPGSGGRSGRAGSAKLSPFWTDCPHCDLDNMLSCDTFDGDQCFQVIPFGGLWALFHCCKCGIIGFNTDTLLWRALDLMRTVRGMKEAEQ